MEKMQAMAFSEFGSPEVLHPLALDRPAPGPEEILVRVKAASFNPSDVLVRKGTFRKIISLDSPHVPGVDFSGIIVAQGNDAKKFSLGQEVFGYLDIRRNGSYGEYVVLPEKEAALLPKGLTHEEAASVPLAYLTAYEALIRQGHLKAGSTVLVYGASGGVGLSALYLLANHQAKVYAVAGTASLPLLRNMPLHRLIDYKSESVADAVKEPLDLILNLAPVSKEVMKKLLRLLKPGGVFVSTTSLPDKEEHQEVELRGVQTRRNEEDLAEIARLLNQQKIYPVKSSTWSIRDAAAVHKLHEEGKLHGKAVFVLDFEH